MQSQSTEMKQCDTSQKLNTMDDDEIREREILILSKNSSSQVNLCAQDKMELDNLRANLPPVKLTYPDVSKTRPPAISENGKVFFFDIDNCLYNRSTRIHDLMQIYIHRYFKKNLHLNDKEAHHLHMSYYKQYGLAIEGLVRLHKVDAMEYNRVVDDALPLDEILTPNPKLREMLLELKRSGKVERLWLFTNAYKTHGLRVIHLLGLGDIFDGMTFCDYKEFPLVCKPMETSFERALKDANVSNLDNVYFVDDSEINVKAAAKFGWGKVIQYIELDTELPVDLNTYAAHNIHIIRSILDLKKVCAELF